MGALGLQFPGAKMRFPTSKLNDPGHSLNHSVSEDCREDSVRYFYGKLLGQCLTLDKYPFQFS